MMNHRDRSWNTSEIMSKYPPTRASNAPDLQPWTAAFVISWLLWVRVWEQLSWSLCLVLTGCRRVLSPGCGPSCSAGGQPGGPAHAHSWAVVLNDPSQGHQLLATWAFLRPPAPWQASSHEARERKIQKGTRAPRTYTRKPHPTLSPVPTC